MPWQKGQSGNPRGGKRLEMANGKTLRELAREHTDDCIKALVKIVKDSDNDTARRAAATDLLDRGWGKPTQPLAGDPDMPPVDWAKAPEPVLAWMASQALPDDNVTEH